ncbi:MAG: ribonucleoside-diphosphate reductase, adenosylcobalamin-dependent, partial [Chlamydiia bacterium]|nr:ribonucleoside-diphosphate reductase, adenosylcobalamin-dependent [Chlamydiia bacterium]
FNYNSLASTVWFNKYANEKLEEKMPAQMHKRMAKVFYDVEEKYYKAEVERLNKGNKSKNLDYLKDNLSDYGFRRTPLSEKSIFKLFARFKYVIPQGSVMSQAGTEEIGSLSNCMVTEAPSDSYGGIMKTDQELAQMFKRRCGAGTDISTLRPAGAGTSNVAKTSTGAVSFMHRFSNTTREVAQGSRRGALMLTMDILHPDIMDFITVKNDLTKVTGANISVKVNDTFMKAVENDEEICLRWPIELEVPERYDDMELNELYTVDGGYVKWTNAKVIWDTLIKSTHATAEPGILFWDQIIKHSPEGFSYPAFTALSTNPCGEIPLPAYDSCRLMALNLTAFVVNKHSPEAFFDFDQFYAAVYEAMRLSDDLVDMELDAVQRIIDKIMKDPEQLSVKKVELDMWNKIYATGKAGRRTGLGFTALGDAAAYLGVTYGGEDFQRILKSLMHTKMKAEFDCSIDLAITRGQFKDYDATQEFYRIDDKYYGANSFYTLMVEEFPEQVERMIKHGRRNISVSTVAPTGSLSMLAEVSSGIEPVFNILHVR